MIKINHYNKFIKKTGILLDINYTFEDGKIYGIYGHNGSGKTMLLRAVIGLIKPTSGMVEIDGKILGRDILFADNAGCLIETPSFIPYYSGYENLAILAKIKGKITSDQIGVIMREIGLEPSYKLPVRKYSLGMKQRLGIACAFMEKPDIILLDEPFNALDDEGVLQAFNLIKKAQERGAIILVTSHQHDYLKQISDKLLKISEGKLYEIEKNI